MADDDVQLTDLEVIQRFSLAVRAATGSRAEVVAALQADLAFLTAAPKAPSPPAKAASTPVKSASTPAKAASTPAKSASTPAKAARARKA